MRNIRQTICVVLLFFTIVKTSAQEECVFPIDTLAICYNGSFELGLTSNYALTNDFNLPQNSFSCIFDASGLTPYTSAVGLNQFSDHITFVDEGYDPNLAAFGFNLDRVYEGHRAIKLNDNVANIEVTSLNKSFIVKDTIVSFRFVLVSQNPTSAIAYVPPLLRAVLYDSNDVIIDEYCLVVDETNTIFHSVVQEFDELLYTEWTCVELTAIGRPEESMDIDEEGRLEILVTDNGKGLFATVYIDDICDGCCPECPEFFETIETGDVEYKQAETCIKAYNTIESGAENIYHAGYEVLLLPCTEGGGFSALGGSKDHYYIDDCSDNFVERQTMPQGKTEPKPTGSLQIYPNPTNSELNIVSADTSVKTIRLVSLDGKLVLERQPGAENNKDIKLDVNALSSGIYILTVETDDGSVTTHKIVRE